MPNLRGHNNDSPSNVLAVEDRFLKFDGYFDIFNIIVREDTSTCGTGCGTLSYLVNLEVNKGILRFNPSFD